MEDIFKFLFVLAILVAGVISQMKKDAKKKAASKPVSPEHPLPENWGGDTPWIPVSQPEAASAAPQTQAEPLHKPMQKTEKKKKTPPRPFIPHEAADTTTHRSTASDGPVTPPATTPNDTSRGINATDIEEVRKAVIWSAILQRPYEA